MYGEETRYFPCTEAKRCFYEDWHFDSQMERKIKYCRILVYQDGKPPYKIGECPYYKNTKNTYSGSHEGEEYSPELVDKIRNAEYEYKLRHGIIGRRGRVL